MNKSIPTKQQLIDAINAIQTMEPNELFTEEVSRVVSYCDKNGKDVTLNRGALI